MAAALNVEFKARCGDLARLRQILESLGARFVGVDAQRDTYFRVPAGRLKLRQGTIETSLIHYDRPDEAGLKPSMVQLYHPADAEALRPVLAAALPLDVVVEKRRGIYFVGNVKVHLDEVDGLGTFVEVEAIDTDGSRTEEALREQCAHFQRLFGVEEADLLSPSYSDLLRERSGTGERR